MTIVIKGNLILEKDTQFNESIDVRGNIIGINGTQRSLIVKGDIKACNIIVHNLSANNVCAWGIKASNITANDISMSGDITAIDIIATGDISAEDIKTWNISAKNIKYYGVCYAYQNINCKSIKGESKHAKHFVLDGELVVKEKKQ